MIKNLITKERLCTLATVVYHCLFISGASFYVTEFQKTRDTIIQQVDRVEEQANKVKKSGDDIASSIKIVDSRLQTVESICSKLRF